MRSRPSSAGRWRSVAATSSRNRSTSRPSSIGSRPWFAAPSEARIRASAPVVPRAAFLAERRQPFGEVGAVGELTLRRRLTLELLGATACRTVGGQRANREIRPCRPRSELVRERGGAAGKRLIIDTFRDEPDALGL